MDTRQNLESGIGTEQASDDEQAQYEEAYETAMRSLHSGQVAQKTVQRVTNAKNPVEGVAKAVFVLVRRTEEQTGGLDDAVKIQIAEDLVEEVLDLMVESSRLQDADITEELVTQIVQELYSLYTEDAERRGTLDPKQVEEDVQEGQRMTGAEKPQGFAAMSNQEVKARGLMDV